MKKNKMHQCFLEDAKYYVKDFIENSDRLEGLKITVSDSEYEYLVERFIHYSSKDINDEILWQEIVEKFVMEKADKIINKFAALENEDRSSQIVEDIKWFMFDDETETIINNKDFTHDLKFVTWAGDGHSFIVTDHTGKEYRVLVQEESK